MQGVFSGIRGWVSGCMLFLLCAGGAAAGDRITVQPLLRVEQSYTDNLFLSETDTEEDIITTTSVGARGGLARRTGGFQVEYRIGYSHYQRFSENDALRHNADFDAWWSMTHHDQLELSNQLRVTEEPEEDLSRISEDREAGFAPEPGEVNAETVRRTRNRYLQNNLNLKYVRQLGPDDTLTFAYRQRLLRNEDRAVRDEEAHHPSVALNYWLLPGRLQMKGNFAYDREDVQSAVGDPGYLEERIRPGVSLTYWILPRQFSLRGGIEYTRGVYWDDALVVEPEAVGIREDNWYESLTPSIGFSYRWVPRRLELDGEISRERAITYGNDGRTDASDDFETWSGRLMVTHFFRRNLDIFGEYTYAHTDFFRDDGNNEDYTVQGPTLGFRYQLAEEIPLELSLGYLVREQERSGREAAITVNGALGEWAFVRSGTLRFDATSGYTDTNLGAERLGFGFYYDAELVLAYRFSPEWSASMRGYYRRNRFLDYEDRQDPTGEIRDDRISEFSAGLSYQMWRWLFLQIRYAYRDVKATEAEDSYTENRVTVQIGVSPPRPWRVK